MVDIVGTEQSTSITLVSWPQLVVQNLFVDWPDSFIALVGRRKHNIIERPRRPREEPFW